MNELRVTERLGCGADAGPAIEPLELPTLPQHLFDRVIERTELPKCFPWAAGALVASEEWIRHADENTPPTRYRRWPRYPPSQEECIWVERRWKLSWKLSVWPHQGLWFIMRHGFRPRLTHVLCFLFGPSIICAPNCAAAKRLAVYHHLIPGDRGGGMLWMDVTQ